MKIRGEQMAFSVQKMPLKNIPSYCLIVKFKRSELYSKLQV